jgi:hypothetical protein
MTESISRYYELTWHYTTNQNVTCSSTDKVTEFLSLLNGFSHTMVLKLSQHLTETSTRNRKKNVSEEKSAVGAENLSTIYETII